MFLNVLSPEKAGSALIVYEREQVLYAEHW